MTDPTEADLRSPAFNAIWRAIKDWDIADGYNLYTGQREYSGAIGNHVMAILKELRDEGLLLEDIVQAAGDLERLRPKPEETLGTERS